MLCIGISRGSMFVSTVGTDSCAPGEYVAFTQDEVSQYLASPFNLTVDQGGAVAAAVLGVWAIGYGIRMVIRTVRHTSDGLGSDSE